MFQLRMIALYFLLLFLTKCASDPGSIDLTDEVFTLPGCEEARRVNKDEPC